MIIPKRFFWTADPDYRYSLVKTKLSAFYGRYFLTVSHFITTSHFIIFTSAMGYFSKGFYYLLVTITIFGLA